MARAISTYEDEEDEVLELDEVRETMVILRLLLICFRGVLKRERRPAEEKFGTFG